MYMCVCVCVCGCGGGAFTHYHVRSSYKNFYGSFLKNKFFCRENILIQRYLLQFKSIIN